MDGTVNPQGIDNSKEWTKYRFILSKHMLKVLLLKTCLGSLKFPEYGQSCVEPCGSLINQAGQATTDGKTIVRSKSARPPISQRNLPLLL